MLFGTIGAARPIVDYLFIRAALIVITLREYESATREKLENQRLTLTFLRFHSLRHMEPSLE
jgi:hypothetical protein